MDSIGKATWVAVLFLCALPGADAADKRAARHFQVEAYRGDASVSQLVSYRLACAPNSTAGLATDQTIVADCVRAALAGKGMYEAKPGTTPEVEITVSFLIEERVEAEAPGLRRFRPVTHRVRTIEVSETEADGTARLIPQEIVVPVDDGYVASTSKRRIVTRFAKRLEIAARTPAHPEAARTLRELWRVRVSNKDETADPDAYARMMVATAVPFIAAETDGRAAIVVPADGQPILLARTHN